MTTKQGCKILPHKIIPEGQILDYKLHQNYQNVFKLHNRLWFNLKHASLLEQMISKDSLSVFGVGCRPIVNFSNSKTKSPTSRMIWDCVVKQLELIPQMGSEMMVLRSSCYPASYDKLRSVPGGLMGLQWALHNLNASKLYNGPLASVSNWICSLCFSLWLAFGTHVRCGSPVLSEAWREAPKWVEIKCDYHNWWHLRSHVHFTLVKYHKNPFMVSCRKQIISL